MRINRSLGAALAVILVCSNGFAGIAAFAVNPASESVFLTDQISFPTPVMTTLGCMANIDGSRKVTIVGRVSENAGCPVSIRIIDPKRQVEYLGTAVTDQNGEFTTSYTMENSTYGRYQVTVNALFCSNAYATSFDYGANSNLKSITIEGSKWDQAFDSKTNVYNLSVPYSTAKMKLAAVTSDPFAEISVNGIKIGTGSITNAVPLNLGGNLVELSVKALDGNSKIYRLNVVRETGDMIQITAEASINEKEGLVIKGSTAKGAGQMIAIKVKDPKGQTSYLGSTVTGYDGSFTFKDISAYDRCGRFDILLGCNGSKTLLIPAEHVSLTGLTSNSGSLYPSFSPDITTYEMTLDDSVDKIRLTPKCFDAEAIINVDGNETTSGKESKDIPLIGGLNIVNVTVRGHEGTTAKTYTLRIKSAKKLVQNGNLNVAFDNKKKFTITGRIGLEERQFVNILIRDPKNNIVYVGAVQTSDGGNYSLSYIMDDWQYGTYNITVGKEGLIEPLYATLEIKKEKAELESLSIENAEIAPKFDQEKMRYTSSVSYTTSKILVNAKALDPLGTVTVNGQEIKSGTVSDEMSLNVGVNQVDVTVSNLAGETKTYNIAVTRMPEPVKTVTQTPVNPPVVDPAHDASLIDILFLGNGNDTLESIDESGNPHPVATIKVPNNNGVVMNFVTKNSSATLQLITITGQSNGVPLLPNDPTALSNGLISGSPLPLSDTDIFINNTYYIKVTSVDQQVERYYLLKFVK